MFRPSILTIFREVFFERCIIHNVVLQTQNFKYEIKCLKHLLKYKIFIIDKYFPKIVMEGLRRTTEAPIVVTRF
jgi:hypothetical protein